MCLTNEGQIYAWGGTLYKKIGTSSTGSHEPTLVKGLMHRRVTYIDCGDFHSVALDSEGKLYTWGGGGQSYNKGQCGHGTLEDVEAPTLVSFFEKKKVIKVSAGGFHTLALCEDSELYGWGNGIHGECGNGESVQLNVPKLVKMPKDLSSFEFEEDQNFHDHRSL